MYSFLGEKRTDRFRKLKGFGRIGPAPRTVFFFPKIIFVKEIWPVKVWCAHTPHTTTPHTTHYTIQQSHRPHRGPTQAHAWLGVLPVNKRSVAAAKQEQLAGSAGKKRPHHHHHSLRTRHHNMTSTHVMTETRRTTAAADTAAATAVILAAAARAARAASNTTARANDRRGAAEKSGETQRKSGACALFLRCGHRLRPAALQPPPLQRPKARRGCGR